MRTTLAIDDDLLQAARSLARMRSLSLGTVISDLARKGLESRCRIRIEDGLPVVDLPPGAPPITLEMIKSLEDEGLSLALLDVNVLVALAWPSHIHYGLAHRWFVENAATGWATCPITECGLVRIISNPRMSPFALTPRDALRLARQLTDRPDHVFWPDAVAPSMEGLMPMDRIVGHQQVTDAYLLALAAHHGGRLVTLDRGISDLVPAESPLRGALEVLSDAG